MKSLQLCRNSDPIATMWHGDHVAERKVVNNRYELQRLPLGRGGMGEVWVGHDARLDREVAVKFVRFDDEASRTELIRRFVRESRITARLQHPGVPAVFDVGTEDDSVDGRPYIVMQRVHGTTIKDLVVEHGRLPIGWAAAIAAQVCSVLAAAHHESLVHRDLKPANIMLEPDGTVKVLDFGLAVAVDTSDSLLTRAGQTIGTPAYMAPEQVLAATSTPATDLYALGITLHEMLTGKPVFTGATAYAVMNKHVDEPPEPPKSHREDIPEGLNGLVAELLAKKPEHRPGSAEAVYHRLRQFIADLDPIPGVLYPPSSPSPVRMYAAVAGVEPAVPVEPPPDEPPPDPVPQPAIVNLGDLEEVRAVANDLANQARFREAADLLAAATERAEAAHPNTDHTVLNIRLEWANILFEGGDYRAASPIYQSLITVLTDRDGPTAELTFRCRAQYATCQAKLGNMPEAIATAHALLTDQQRIYRSRDPRPFDLRRHIGTWQLAAGRRTEAEQTLHALLADLIATYGGSHPAIPKIQALLKASK
jgi:serine/threonine protein kinase